MRARREGARLRGSPTRVLPLSFSPPGATTTREVECPGGVSAPSLRLLSERTHSPAHTVAGWTGSPLVSAPSRADQNLRDPQPRSDKARETCLRWLPKAPTPANGWSLIGGRGGGGASRLTPSHGFALPLAHSRVFSEGLPVRTEGGEGRLGG